MLYTKSQSDPKKPRKPSKPSDKVVLQMGDVSDILSIHSDKKSRKAKHKDSCDQLETQTLGQARELFLLIKDSLFEEDNSIYERYWEQVFQQYYSN